MIMKNPSAIKNPVKEFFLRGLIFAGGGPIIVGIVYLILQYALEDFSLSGTQVFVAILSTYLLTFVHAGSGVFHQIESWSLGKSALCQLGLLYLCYTVCYVMNSWIPFEPIALAIFTAIFVGGYGVIWLAVYLSVNATVRRLNKKLH